MKNGKKFKALWLFIALIASLAIVAGIYFLSVPRLTPIDEHTTEPFSDVNFVSIDAVVSNISVTIGGDEFQARLHGKSVDDEQFRAHLTFYTDPLDPLTLNIKEQRLSHFRFIENEQLWLDVVLPENYYGGVKLNSASGKINAENVKSNALFVTSISGDISLSNCSFAASLSSSLGAMSIGSGSGRIALSNITTNQLDISTTSGEVTASGCAAGRYEVQSISGAIKLTEADAGELIVSTTSGEVDAQVLTLERDAQFDSMSGSISLAFPKNLPLSFDLSSISGEIIQDYPNTEGGVPVVVVTLSGNQTVKEQ